MLSSLQSCKLGRNLDRKIIPNERPSVAAHAYKLWHLRRLRQEDVRSIPAWLWRKTLSQKREQVRGKGPISPTNWDGEMLQSNTLSWKCIHSISKKGTPAPRNSIPGFRSLAYNQVPGRPVCSLVIFNAITHKSDQLVLIFKTQARTS